MCNKLILQLNPLLLALLAWENVIAVEYKENKFKMCGI